MDDQLNYYSRLMTIIEKKHEEASHKANLISRTECNYDGIMRLKEDVNKLFDEINALIESGACKTLTLKQYDQLLAIISSWHRYFICYGIVMKLPAIPNLDSIQPSSVAKRIKRDVLVGKVVNISGNKTVKIETFRTYEHKVYGKIIKKRKCYLAHDENNLAQIGDKVLIASCRPMSKTKHFRLLRIVRSAKDSTWDCSTNATGRMYESNE